MWSLCLPTVVLLHLVLLGFSARFDSIGFDFVAIPEAYKYNDTLALRYLWLLICYSSKIFWFLLKNSLEIRHRRRSRWASKVCSRCVTAGIFLGAQTIYLPLFLFLFLSLSLILLLYGLTVVRVEDSMRPGANSGHPTTPRPPNRRARFARFGLVYRVDICANLCKKCNLPHKKYMYIRYM